MVQPCHFFLTICGNSGYLFPLLPTFSMRLQQRLDSVTAEFPAKEARIRSEQPHAGFFNRIRSSVRARVLATGLALGGGAFATQQADAATMHTAQFIAPEDETELSDFAVGFDIRDGVFVDIVNGSDATREAIDFVLIYREEHDYGIDRAGDFGSDVPTEITPNSEFSDGITHNHMFVRGMEPLPELSRYRIGADIDPLNGDPDGPADIDDFFGNAIVMVGKNGTLSGTPTTPEELEGMYSGDIWHARFPIGAGVDDNYLMTDANVPEPTSAGLAAGLAAGAAAAARRRRRE